MISLQHLKKEFGETIAVDDISFDVADGDVFGLIGPDGAGKTTTLRVISTAMTPTEGTVTVGDLDVIREAEAVKKLIGYMPQRFALYPDLTVMENLNFFADLFGSPPAERHQQAERLLGFAALSEFKSRRAEKLSGGMQKKLALAATLMHKPRVLLLDEPTTGVDPVSRREFWDLITQLHLEGVTILLSTPYLDEAERCTRVALMHRGKLIANDTPTALRGNLGAIAFEGKSRQPMEARKHGERQPGVLSASIHGDVLRLLVDRADRLTAIEADWVAAKIDVSELHIVRPRLEDAFVLAVNKNA